MPTSISSSLSSSGRSPEADRIYQQYLSYYADINAKIHAIDGLPYDQRNQPNVQKDRALLVALQQQLGSIYGSDYNNSNATLASFEDDCAGIESQVNAAYNDAMGGGSGIHSQIEQDYINAQNAIAVLKLAISKDSSNLNNLAAQLATLEAKIASLQQQIDTLPEGPKKAEAQKDLNTASQALGALKAEMITVQSQLAILQGKMDTMTKQGGTLDQLEQLAAKENPNESDLDKANNMFADTQSAKDLEQSVQTALSTANSSLPAINTAIQTVETDLKPDPTIHDKIEQDYLDAQNAIKVLQKAIDADAGNLNTLQTELAALEAKIKSLQQQIDTLPDGSEKTEAQKDLAVAVQFFNALDTQAASAQMQLVNLQVMMNRMTSKGGTLDLLQQLALKQNPDQADLDAANGLLGGVQAAQTFEQSTVQPAIIAASSAIAAVTAAIKVVEKDLNPTPSGTIEHGTWYIDWTSWDFPVPDNVNTVNIFVGNMHLDANGNPVIDGFGNMTDAKLDAFVKACHDKGITVKISIGGGGGSYDHLWNVLTKDNVQSCAQALANFCNAHGVDGVDFDCEEFTSAQDRPEQQALVGTFIKDFKNINPNFQTSLCTNAGFGPYFPWQGIVKNILDAATTIDPKTGEKVCAVDRMYIMSYYNPINDEEGWVSGWANWLETNYNFTPARITVGLDDTDAHAYDIKEFAAWAATQGFSTCYWEWNPATEKQSNDSTKSIEDAYNKAQKPDVASAEFADLLQYVPVLHTAV